MVAVHSAAEGVEEEAYPSLNHGWTHGAQLLYYFKHTELV